MSVRIKVSYTDEKELAKLQRRLAPGIERCRLPKEQKGEHKRAYIDWNSNASDQEKKENLIPNYERSPEELREMGRKGGIASGEARRKKRDLQREASLWLKVFEDLGERGGMEADEILDKLREEIAKRERSPGEAGKNAEKT